MTIAFGWVEYPLALMLWGFSLLVFTLCVWACVLLCLHIREMFRNADENAELETQDVNRVIPEVRKFPTGFRGGQE